VPLALPVPMWANRKRRVEGHQFSATSTAIDRFSMCSRLRGHSWMYEVGIADRPPCNPLHPGFPISHTSPLAEPVAPQKHQFPPVPHCRTRETPAIGVGWGNGGPFTNVWLLIERRTHRGFPAVQSRPPGRPVETSISVEFAPPFKELLHFRSKTYFVELISFPIFIRVVQINDAED
jgi:hypothetical protein